MATKEIDIIKERTAGLSREEKVELIDFVTKSLTNGGRSSQTRSSVLDILEARPVRRVFANSAEVDEWLRKERDSWDD